MIENDLNAVIATPDQFNLREIDSVPGVRVHSSVILDHLPAALLQLPDGIHEYETSTDAWLVALATTADGRYSVVEDISLIENRERQGLLIAIIGTILATYTALGLGLYLSRRLIAPLAHLSRRILEEETNDSPRPIANDFARDEVGALASTLDHYRHRVNDALRREREFSSEVSHELRNPLTVIQNAAEIIDGDSHISPASRRAVRRITMASSRMQETTNALLLMVREHTNTSTGETVSVAESVESLLENTDTLAASGTIAVEWQCHSRPELSAPRIAVDVIVANLIRNAFQHSHGSRISITLEHDRLIISDDGVGIPIDDLSVITRQRKREVASGSTSGTGLGLPFVQRLCDRFAWQLILRSEAGRGLCVEWRFIDQREAVSSQLS
ncbi:MAG: HAMP domain-containing sensor histidine kinase [Aquisalimonadaceae bacterium]